METLLIPQDDLDNKIHNLTIFPKGANILVAVSGGSDSLCLAIMLQSFCKKIEAKLTAVIIDHKLRAESTEEANFVACLLKKHDINSKILSRSESPIISAVQKRAREDRYFLLREYAKETFSPYLFVAHHLDDNLETIELRKSLGYNYLGDSGISAKVIHEDVILLRPFLDYTKDQILKTLKQFSDIWVEDPSNTNIKYARVKKRYELAEISCEEKNTLVVESKLRSMNRIIVEKEILSAISKSVLINRWGLIKINNILFNKYTKRIKILMLGRLIRFANSQDYEPKKQKIDNLISMIQNNDFKKATLGNCLIKKIGDIIIILHNKSLKEKAKVKQLSSYWSNSFVLTKRFYDDIYISSLDINSYIKLISDKTFKQYFSKHAMKTDSIMNLPWIFDKNHNVLNWENGKYKYIEYKSKNSILMDFFSNLKIKNYGYDN